MQSIEAQRKIEPFIVFFVIASTQIGSGFLVFQRTVAKSAGYDAWIAVIIAGIMTHIVMFLIYKMLKEEGADLASIHQQVFGKWLGGLFNLLFVGYFCYGLLTVTRTYIELVQVWMFPDLNVFLFTLFFFVLVFYAVNSGLRVIGGLSFFSIVLPLYLIFIFLFILPYTDFRNFFPIYDHSIKEILQATKDLTVVMIGYEIILVFYPFIKNGQQSKKWAHFGLLFTTLIYLYTTVLSFAFFSEEQLKETIWPTLSMLKIVELPFIERFEYIGVINWNIIIIPNVCIYLWCASRLLKRTVKIQQRKSVVGLLFIILLIIPQLETRYQVDKLDDYFSDIGFIINYLYIPLLFVLLSIVRKVKKRQ
ncbi:GerAB/ArcD/ProY family transporter [Bacillus aerolatus]|uniref:GerAB/ArcD/ProY family transporter n=1 Tax=Bacillus aerolatus TaxID=2653354 RepID=A0A6I1FGL1_9BACI|nr:GerAB/ArcD/ProY family transporter [Bacillus aerolatus]KAB7707352.1 GerAB/ArcD/ProY family transporter [Bacillus aerolatus]